MTDRQFEENIARICRNDKEGLRAIYEDYCGLIYSTVLEILHSKEDAEDVTSEFFIRLWDIAEKYHAGRGHRAWMLTVARNLAIDTVRRRRHEDVTDELPEPPQEGRATTEEQVCGKLSLEQALAALKEEERQVVHLKIVGELTFREIAGVLQKPQGTVAWCYRTAIKKLKEVQL